MNGGPKSGVERLPSPPSQRQTDGQTAEAGHREDREMDWNKLKRKQADKTLPPSPFQALLPTHRQAQDPQVTYRGQRTNRSGWGRPGVEVSTLSPLPSSLSLLLQLPAPPPPQALLPPTHTPKEGRPCWVSMPAMFWTRNTELPALSPGSHPSERQQSPYIPPIAHGVSTKRQAPAARLAVTPTLSHHRTSGRID